MEKAQEVPNTSVGRLVAITQRLRKMPPDKPMVGALSEAFLIPDATTSELLKGLSEFINEIEKAKQELREFTPFSEDIYQNHFNRLETFASQISFEKKWANITNEFPLESINALQIFDDIVKQKSKFSKIKENEIKEIKLFIEEAYKQTIDANIEEELKLILTDNLDNVLKAITNYQISGLNGIERAYERSAGALLLRKKLVDNELEKPESQTELAHFWRALEKVHNLIQTANSTRDLVAPMTSLLGI